MLGDELAAGKVSRWPEREERRLNQEAHLLNAAGQRRGGRHGSIRLDLGDEAREGRLQHIEAANEIFVPYGDSGEAQFNDLEDLRDIESTRARRTERSAMGIDRGRGEWCVGEQYVHH